MLSDVLAPLLALSDEQAEAEVAQLPWPGDGHAVLLSSRPFQDFLAAAGVNDVLRPLVTGAGLRIDHEMGGYEVTPAGGAWLATQLLQDGRRLTAEQRQTGRDALHANLGRALTGVLTSLKTGSSTIRTYAGLRGLLLADSDELDVGVGRLRRLEPAEIRSLSFDATLGPPSADEICLVSEGKATWRVVDKPDRHRPLAPRAATSVDLLPLLIMLAGAQDRKGHSRAPHIAWTRTSPYFFAGGTPSGGSNPGVGWRTSSIFDAVVTSEVASVARKTLPQLRATFSDALRIPARRLVSAALVFDKSHEDRLIDASIAWEGLFGSQANDQLSLQLALSIAWILQPNEPIARRQVFDRAKKIYGLRSKVVHGGSAMTADVEAAAEELLEWLRHILLTLLTTHASLVGAKDGLQQLVLQDFRSVTKPGG